MGKPTKESTQIFASTINEYLKRTGKTNQQLADDAGVSKTTISRLRNGGKASRVVLFLVMRTIGIKKDRFNDLFRLGLGTGYDQKYGPALDPSELEDGTEDPIKPKFKVAIEEYLKANETTLEELAEDADVPWTIIVGYMFGSDTEKEDALKVMKAIGIPESEFEEYFEISDIWHQRVPK